MSDIPGSNHLLTTALVGALLPKDVPEGHMVRAWLDSWAGLGRVADAMRAARNRDRGFAVQDLDQRIVRRGVLTQLLTRVKREERNLAGLPLDDNPAD